MSRERVDMDRLAELVRLHRKQTPVREIARLLRMGPGTERKYRLALEAAGVLWTESMHSRAHHDRDPIYGAMRAHRMEVQGPEIAGKCVRCHNARSPDDPDTVAGRAGVSCAVCHNAAEAHREPGQVGVDALTWDKPGMLRAARDLPAGASPVHGTGPARPALADGTTICLACHDATKTPGGAAACTTGPEYRDGGSPQSCTDCHMPEQAGPVGAFGRQDRHRSHRFLGPHRAWYQDDDRLLSEATQLDLAFDGDALVLTVANRSAHAFPSGFPGRMVVFDVVGRDASGAVVWRNHDGNPAAQSPDSLLRKVYEDADGKPVPAPFSVRLALDTRLLPDETRRLRYAPPPTVVEADATLRYFLLPPKLADRLGLADAPEARPKAVATATARR